MSADRLYCGKTLDEIKRQLKVMKSGEWSMCPKHMQALVDEIDRLNKLLEKSSPVLD